jgi:2-amino-4-hydroxy-6-hydroxymethyldihydropteridine diphosphokinase
MSYALIGLGANLHDRAAALREAISRLVALPEIRFVAASSFHQTAAVGGPANQHAFLNAALLVETSLHPVRIADELLACERTLGRRRDKRWGPRAIDLDLLLFDDRVVDLPQLTVPHPRMSFRRFVLEPACEVAATMLHPTSGWSLSRLMDHLGSGPDYIALSGGDESERTCIARQAAARAQARVISFMQPPGAADPPATAEARSLEWVKEAARRLARQQWPGDIRPAISDFWFDEPVVAAASAGATNGVRRVWSTHRPGLIQPKLVVWLDSEPLATNTIAEAMMDGEDMASWLARQPPRRAAFYRHVLANDIGPTLRLEAGDANRCADEIAAAIMAMQPTAAQP